MKNSLPKKPNHFQVKTVLYTLAKESPNSSHGLKFVGSEDATTCHIVVIREQSSGKTALIHLDDVNSSALDHVTKQVCDGSEETYGQNVEIHIFGGYEDENDTSEDLSLGLLKYLIRGQYK